MIPVEPESTGIVRMTARLRPGSMRHTEPPAGSVTHTAPPPTAIALSLSAAHRNPDADPVGTRIDLCHRAVEGRHPDRSVAGGDAARGDRSDRRHDPAGAGSIRETVSSGLMTQTAPAPTAIALPAGSRSEQRRGLRERGQLRRRRHEPRERIDPREVGHLRRARVLARPHPDGPLPDGEVGRGASGRERAHRLRLGIDPRDGLVVRVQHPDGPLSHRDARRARADRDRLDDPAALRVDQRHGVRRDLHLGAVAPEQRRDQRHLRRCERETHRPGQPAALRSTARRCSRRRRSGRARATRPGAGSLPRGAAAPGSARARARRARTCASRGTPPAPAPAGRTGTAPASAGPRRRSRSGCSATSDSSSPTSPRGARARGPRRSAPRSATSRRSARRAISVCANSS